MDHTCWHRSVCGTATYTLPGKNSSQHKTSSAKKATPSTPSVPSHSSHPSNPLSRDSSQGKPSPFKKFTPSTSSTQTYSSHPSTPLSLFGPISPGGPHSLVGIEGDVEIRSLAQRAAHTFLLSPSSKFPAGVIIMPPNAGSHQSQVAGRTRGAFDVPPRRRLWHDSLRLLGRTQSDTTTGRDTPSIVESRFVDCSMSRIDPH
ncbi:unnamed protein product [Acanthosepion pharaonis]|uniref:Uncharacterized protein n=1 Tax=Acanthosepion pharaonis TaxID=158019 RepID=A0A812B929_ACAPH|nr:unnamed protein product [Sepia pharaonis]